MSNPGRLQIGAPADLIASSKHVEVTKLSFIGQVGGIVGDWLIGEHPGSALDFRLLGVLEKMGGSFDRAIGEYADHTRSTHGVASENASALHTTDIDGRGRMRRSESA
ncbi:hypothetical protein [Nocardia nova]|uniref:hypothetical protein n=1 Tax=Nocardia nova TaxID=37330 RepID=UPI0034046A51